MLKEYKYKVLLKGLANYFLRCSIIILFAGFLIYTSLKQKQISILEYLIFGGLFLYFIIDFLYEITYKILISDDCIIFSTLFGREKIVYGNIIKFEKIHYFYKTKKVKYMISYKKNNKIRKRRFKHGAVENVNDLISFLRLKLKNIPQKEVYSSSFSKRESEWI